MKSKTNMRPCAGSCVGNIHTRFIKVAIACVLFCAIMPVYAADLTVTVNATSFIRAIPDTMYGTNVQCWDGVQNGGNDRFNNLLANSCRRYIRWPGGSWGDYKLWSDMEWGESATWIVSYDESMYLFNKLDAIIQPIVNFHGNWQDANHFAEAITSAVSWVQDQSSRIPTARYWEIGNETYGSWEGGYDANINGTYYGNRFADFYTPMKAANPQIKIGAVAREYDSDYDGWTRKLLNAAYAKSVVPDFLIIHEYPGIEANATYNTTLLGQDVYNIANFTTSLNSIVSSTLGSQYVGKIKYWMTEWDSGWKDPGKPYDRHKCYVNAMFHSQYILEMAKYGWEGSNQWSQWEYASVYQVYPVWYVAPLLANRFGRDMVYAADSHALVRAYASRDDANNLTIFVVNNSPDTNLTATVNISNFSAAATGQQWLIVPAGTIVDGGLTIQDKNKININGVEQPDPNIFNTISGVPITTSNSFDVNLPKSCMLLLKVPPASPTEQSPYGGVIWSIPGTIEAENYDLGGKFVSYYDTNSGNSGGQYRSDDVDIETCSEGGYDVNGIYVGEWLEYAVNVESSGIYKVHARVASADSNGAFRIEFDGQDITGPVGFPATGGAQTFTTVDVNHIFLNKGQYTMRLLMDANGWSINWISFTKVGGGTGKALREWWTNISGSTVSSLTSDVNYPYNPSGRELSHSFEGPSNWVNKDNYGTRIRGYLHPVADGNYTFWIASNDGGELWFSTDADPCHASKIAYVASGVYPYKWDKTTVQKSSSIPLIAGQEYYIEALHKEGTGDVDSIAVAWEGPGLIRQAITGPYLTPYIINFTDFANFANQWLRTDCATSNGWCRGADLSHNGSVTFEDLMVFVEDWWLFGAE